MVTVLLERDKSVKHHLENRTNMNGRNIHKLSHQYTVDKGEEIFSESLTTVEHFGILLRRRYRTDSTHYYSNDQQDPAIYLYL